MSVLCVQKGKPIKKAHSPTMSTGMAAEGAAALSTTPGLSVFARESIVPSAGTPPPHQWPPRGRYSRVGTAPAPIRWWRLREH